MNKDLATEIIEALAEITTTLAGIEDALWDISENTHVKSENVKT